MMLGIYAFFDKKASFYSAPFFMAHDALAMRAASELANDTSTAIGRHPSDFDLMKLGHWDDQVAAFHTPQPETLVVCSALVQSTQGSLV